jgi:hypothetical protein
VNAVAEALEATTSTALMVKVISTLRQGQDISLNHGPLVTERWLGFSKPGFKSMFLHFFCLDTKETKQRKSQGLKFFASTSS